MINGSAAVRVLSLIANDHCRCQRDSFRQLSPGPAPPFSPYVRASRATMTTERFADDSQSRVRPANFTSLIDDVLSLPLIENENLSKTGQNAAIAVNACRPFK